MLNKALLASGKDELRVFLKVRTQITSWTDDDVAYKGFSAFQYNIDKEVLEGTQDNFDKLWYLADTYSNDGTVGLAVYTVGLFLKSIKNETTGAERKLKLLAVESGFVAYTSDVGLFDGIDDGQYCVLSFLA